MRTDKFRVRLIDGEKEMWARATAVDPVYGNGRDISKWVRELAEERCRELGITLTESNVPGQLEVEPPDFDPDAWLEP